MKKEEVLEQIKISFDSVDKLFSEVSFLIKELEGLFSEEPEDFVIVKPSGYGITTRSSTGLEPNNVKLWLLKKLSVAFVPKIDTNLKNGITATEFGKNLKIIYIRIVLEDKNISEPTIFCGVLSNFILKRKDKWIKKFENVMGHIEYAGDRFFNDFKNINYEDNLITVQGKLIKIHLLDLNDGESINEKIVQPLLKLYRE